IEKFERHPNVQAELAFQKGYFEIQDLGSQLVSYLIEAKAGMQLLDYCAGAGGKTLALAANMENRGQIYAYDSEKIRLAPIFNRLQRAGIHNVQPRVYKEELKSLIGQMDIVLLDTPCSGTGTWRRRPDAKWRLT
ncbi:MAG: MFS transporter, partial [Bartonella sp.]|nr:MFS transporter [Bartonella sp.]